MNQQVIKSGNPNWKPGVSGNPLGRPLSAKHKIAEKLLVEFTEALETGDPDALKRLKTEDPGKFYTIAAGLMPKEIAVSVQQQVPGSLDPETWHLLLRLLDIIQRHVGEGVSEAQVLEFIEQSLRAEFAKPIGMVMPRCPVVMPKAETASSK